MVLHNPNNWHWVNKNVTAWAKTWFEDNVVNIEAEDGDVTAKISKIVSADGDVDVSQRKGKVITIYEVKLVLEYTGSTGGESEVSGTITIPEVAHDTEEDEYVFDIEIYTETVEKRPVKDLIRSKMVPELRKLFMKLPGALIEEHGKDIQHTKDANPATKFPAAKIYPSTDKSEKTASSSTAAAETSKSTVNTTTVTDTEEFRTTAEQMYLTFTDPQRLAAFTRAPPKRFDGAKKGGHFELFDGNVQGEYLELEEPKKIVQNWRLNQWPAGHFSTQVIEFNQNDADGVTNMQVTWSGVPVGQEEVTKRNWGEYYVRSIKKTFGFGTIL